MTNYNTFMRCMKELDKIAKAGDELKDEREDKRKKASEKIRKYAFSRIPEEVPKDARPKKAEDLTSEEIQRYVQIGQQLANDKATNTFYKNIDSIVDSEIPKKNLEKIIRYKDIIEKTSGKERKVLDSYASWKNFEHLYDKYKASKDLDEEDEKIVKNAAALGIGSTVADSLVSKGYSKDVAEKVKELVYESAIERISDLKKLKKYALPGLKELSEKAKKAYDTITDSSEKAEDIGKAVLKKMAKGSREDFEKAYHIVYEAGKN